MLPFAFITLYFYRAGATGRMKLSMLFYLAIVACIVCMVVLPQHAVLFALCLGPLFAGATAAEASWNPAFTRPGSGDPPATQGDPPSARPVSIDFLHENAGKFLKVLNTPFPLFHNIPTRKGRNTLTIVIYAMAAIMAATAIYHLLAGNL